MSVEELDRLVADVQATAMPEFLEDGSVRIHAMVYERGSLIAARVSQLPELSSGGRMSPFTQLVKLAGKMPKWSSRAEEEAKRKRREYDRQQKREWRKKTGRH